VDTYHTTYSPVVESDSDESSDLDVWQEVEQPDDVPEEQSKRYGLGSNLYDTISARPELDSGHTRLENSWTS
jgi:hypothetical protein